MPFVDLVGTVLHELRDLVPVLVFLGAILVIGGVSEREGLFRAAGALIARAARGEPHRLLLLVITTAALVTAVLGLDATVVLLTPVVFATASHAGVRPRPHVYACTHVANSGSLLLPVSNLTNLLALGATDLDVPRFAALMALPWLLCLAVEYLALRRMFATDLTVAAGPGPGPGPAADAPEQALPRDVVIVLLLLAAMLIGFVLAPLAGWDPSWVALTTAVVLAARSVAAGRTTPGDVLRLVNPRLLLLVIGLGVLAAAIGTVAGDHTAGLLPRGDGLTALLGWALLATVLANLINNLPAAMILITLAAPAGAGPVLAVLIGVNVGPNLTYYGSVATLLWRRILRAHDHDAPLREFTRLGLLTVPVSVLGAVVALWAVLPIVGG